MTSEKYLKYLPSKKFAIIASSVIVLGTIIFVIFFMSSDGENFITGNKKNNSALKVENQTIAELIQKDSDKDGITDWEEDLWGTDKNKKITFGDMNDATYIENKKKELKIESSVNETKLTETEKFAREFFTSYSAMKSSGEIDDETIKNFSSALGQKIVNPELIDKYTESDININNIDNLESRKEYYEKIRNIFKKYQSSGLGDELEIISTGLALNSSNENIKDSTEYEKLPTIAKAYQEFAKEITKVSVPKNLKEYHLSIANSANNTGISVLGMAKIVSDPVVGLSGLSQYQKYSDSLIKTVTDLETFLAKQ
ncbi:MAG: hypothetical protein NDI62_00535 [Burkholderiales bacterium]|nr:hypothetical protein [Burkholderiales bacterium]